MTLEITIPAKMPHKSGVSALRDMPRYRLDGAVSPNRMERGMYSFALGGLEYDFVYSPGVGDKLFVLFSGYADRRRIQPPVFQRWSWVGNFPGHCLYIADPSLKLSAQLGLAWYVGTSHQDAMQPIADLVEDISARLGLELTDVVAYGSSGGGFAALRLLSFLSDITAVAINPQTSITAYDSILLDRFLDVCFGGVTREYARENLSDRLSILPMCPQLQNSKIVYAQNTLDEHHLIEHFQPFAQRMGLTEQNQFQRRNVGVLHFENQGGHAAAEPPELFPVLMQAALKQRQA